jgi:hypothetical protein
MKMMSTSISCPTSERFANSPSNHVERIAHFRRAWLLDYLCWQVVTPSWQALRVKT